MRLSGVCVGFAVVWLLAGARAAGADDKAGCIQAYVDGQTAQKDGKLRTAREKLLACAKPGCPTALAGDCARWLRDVEQSLPTVVIVVRDAGGRELTDVSVVVDGERRAERIDGGALEIDPGEHVFRVERAGAAPVEQRAVLHEGEKNRRVELTFAAPPAPPPVASAAPVAPPVQVAPSAPGPRVVAMERPVPLATFVAGGAGLLSIGGFAVLAATSLAKRNRLASSGCKPSCSIDDVRSIQNGFLTADVLAGAGVVSLAIATALYFTRPAVARPERPEAVLSVGPGGAFAALGGAF